MKKLSIIIPVWNQEELILKALDSIPRRDDIEVLVYDDASTDNTRENVRKYIEEHPELDIKLFYEDENKGVGYARNVLFDNAKGEYIHSLDSDDTLITDRYLQVMEKLDGTDMVYIDLLINDGSVFALNKWSERVFCAGTARFIRREFLGDTRCPELRAAEDWHLNERLLAKEPTELFTGIAAYRYNYPREGSLYDLLRNGKL